MPAAASHRSTNSRASAQELSFAAACQRPGSMAAFWAEELQRSRFYSQLQDVTRHGTEKDDFDKWVIKQEESSPVWYYYHTVDEKRVEWDQDDPRLATVEDFEVMKLFKIQLISDLRFGAYFCRALIQEYTEVETEAERLKILERIRTEPVCKKMAIALVNAKKVWEEKEFNAIDELVEGNRLQEIIAKMLDSAEKVAWHMKEVRKGLLKMEVSKKKICPKCHYEVENASAIYCEVCGFKLFASSGANMTEEEKEEQRRILHKGADENKRKLRATMRSTTAFRSTQNLNVEDFSLDKLDLDVDDDEELGLTPSNSTALDQDSIDRIVSENANFASEEQKKSAAEEEEGTKRERKPARKTARFALPDPESDSNPDDEAQEKDERRSQRRARFA